MAHSKKRLAAALHIALGGEQEVQRIAALVDGAV
jgi:hypothetical protein